MGRTNDRVAQLQESYITNATTGWLESLERSLAMMKEYQVYTLEVNAMGRLMSAGCQKEARESSTRLRCVPFQDAES